MNANMENPGTWQRVYPKIVKLLMVINISLIFIGIGVWVLVGRQQLTTMADFTSFYTAFTMVKNGDAAKLYDPDVQLNYQKEILGWTFVNGVLPYLNPPLVAIIFSPLALFPITTAYYIWALIQLVLLAWFIYLLNRVFSHWHNTERLALFVILLSFWPLIYTFILGQFSLLIAISIVQVYLALVDSKLVRAGLWYIMLIIKPHFAILPGMLTLNRRFWRVALTGLLGGIVINVAPAIFIGISPYRQYLQLLGSSSSYFTQNGVVTDVQYTLREILLNLFGSDQGALINTISLVFLGLGAIGVWWLWMRGKKPDNARLKLFFSFTIFLAAFISIHSNVYDEVILIFPAALFYDYLRELNYPTKTFSTILLISPLVFFITAFSKVNLFGIFRPPAIVIMVILAWMIYYLVVDIRCRGLNPSQEAPLSGLVS